MENTLYAKESARNSSIELLRLLCMLFIIVHHFIQRGIRVAVDNSFENILSCPDWILCIFIEPFFLCAVNVYVLISGYFGIKLKVSSITNLYARCAIYGLLCYCLHLCVDGGTLGRYYFAHECIFSLTNTRWFIAAYLALMLLSPILNASIKYVSRREFILFLGLLTIINVYFGWFGGAAVNPSGCNVMQFIYLYYIGRYLNIYHVSLKGRYAACVYIGAALVSGLLSFLFTGFPGKGYFLFAEKNNNPLLIIESIALLLLFLEIKFSSRMVNWIALSVIAVYLIHCNPWIDESIIYPLISNNYFLIDSMVLRFAAIFGLSILLFCGCIIVDKILSFIIVPISSGLTIFGNRIVSLVDRKILAILSL